MMDGASHEHCSADILPYSWLFSRLKNFTDRSQGLLGLNQCGHKCWDTVSGQSSISGTCPQTP